MGCRISDGAAQCATKNEPNKCEDDFEDAVAEETLHRADDDAEPDDYVW